MQPITPADITPVIDRLKMLFGFYKQEFQTAEPRSKVQSYHEGRMHQAYDTLNDMRAADDLVCECQTCKEEMPF